ncbi:PilZ domain-containing protein [Bradyrhizobium sp. U87765 SZCCT0131]|uniref:PilZ domain-containing protein n=1 Tax=unclassified Bradyrhizobium TaxID=2631580 RepID=UPI001BA5CCF5|nr:MULTISPECIES: PilZ domain-containing protein [unclassified Bradyrhizobium]MBR1219521.1 PilZ domain-containing protein [Bradyrhizobium sp. U87765 SZCCT0131]MBR1262172.1 PilZ domain-containing protein [Bradyrhizobium sp. U87765 SZCCT0134]MBR1308645.1 PilZ domain-containing protein [Bradyrhizobium sp. U87765 SZCCT0110]MBR1317954.1 PilZ domain-containing protein [Bradyrhizobium sp. U87765 SZCCT0109]MBR1351657.1 PilZ domain-containing protein [Bradyrhizobium sp. U87765 SZCCT0048]
MATNRKEARKKRVKTDHDAWMMLDGGFARRKCTVLDLSNGGARIRVHDTNPVSGKVRLAFSRDVRKVTHCRLVWRDESIIGLEFMVPV